MNKPADSDFPLHELVQQRWSPLAFADRSIDRQTLGSLFEAARWAASCFNEQPWRFCVAPKEDAEGFVRIASCLVDANRQWAAQAGALAISVARSTFTRNDKPNVHAWHDVGAATAQLSLQAEAMGLRVHQMGGFDADRAREVLQIPDGHNPVAAIAIGYPGTLNDLPEALHQREQAPRARKPMGEILFGAGWESPGPLA